MTEAAELRGRTAFHAGASAEMRIALAYQRRGFQLLAQRWRRGGGEIDLILRDDERIVFVEVKQSSSFERAAERLTAAQMRRIYAAAEVFLAEEAEGQLIDTRFDVALVDGSGAYRIVENAIVPD
ncbi:YraN family protein [Thalassococcus sp. S3]|uniref:YraN family protein n=1 Tax=Thalassococcus sp. S3 TaxID=2017482 RepID=UPI001024461C|nr:YraN family protein [Thalassococcus sp. S3]QBF33596.1 hypothetical protein CFI11_20610 [Thalassococcus sp. S3]